MNFVKAACHHPQHVALRYTDLQYTFSEFVYRTVCIGGGSSFIEIPSC
jgi:hypothetical protein